MPVTELPEAPVLVFEVQQIAPEAAAPEPTPPQPIAPEPPPPVEEVAPPPEPPVVEEPPPPPPPKPVPVVRPTPPPKPKPIPKPTPKPKPQPAPEATAKPQAKPRAATPPPQQPSASAPKADPVVKARYEQVLYSWLSRHKDYPMIARRRGIEGGARVRIRIGRDGHVLAHSLVTGAGHPVLDQAALRMVEQADPFPPVPAEYPGESFEFLAPVEFRLR